MNNISIILVSWNANNYLRKCLDSLYSYCNVAECDVIVVDNDSSDGSQNMVRDHFPDVKLIQSNTNLGFAKANNVGIDTSTGEYVCLINSDVELFDDCIKELVQYLKAHSNIGIISPRILNSDKTLQNSCRGFPSIWNVFCRSTGLDTLFPKTKLFCNDMMTHWAHDNISDVDVLSGCFWVIRKSAIDEVGLLDERFFIYAEDFDWCKRFKEDGWRRVYFPNVEAVHHGGASSENAPLEFYLEMQKSIFLYWKKHHILIARIVFFILSIIHHVIRLSGAILKKFLLGSTGRELANFKIKRHTQSLIYMFRDGRSLLF